MNIHFLLVCFLAFAFAQDPLVQLSDEFDDSSTITQWQRAYMTDNFNVPATRAGDQLEVFDIDQTDAGHMYMLPYSCAWYMEMRGPFVYKNVNTADFVAHSSVYSRSRNPGVNEIPNVMFSMAGVMLRSPRPVEPLWTAAQEDYIFMNVGTGWANIAETEVKTTDNSFSTLVLDSSGLVNNSPRAEIQVARIGEYIICLYRGLPGGSWIVHRRYHRPDLTGPIQAGMTAYTDWNHLSSDCCSAPQALVYNNLVYTAAGNPDLQASFDFYRFASLDIDPALNGADWTDVVAVPDATVLAYLGANSPTI